MNRLKVSSTILAVTFALASSFCYVDCALAKSVSIAPSCHRADSQEGSEKGSKHDAGSTCCSALVALQQSQSQISIGLDQAPHFTFSGVELAKADIVQISSMDLFVPSDSSPPKFFVLTHAVHAPPFHF